MQGSARGTSARSRMAGGSSRSAARTSAASTPWTPRTTSDMTQTTAIEFLHTFKREGQAVQVQAALYYLKHYQSKPRARVSEVVQVLVEARVRNAKKVNWRRALASSAPFARSVEYGVWEITGTGERKLTDEYGVKPAATAGPPQAVADDLAAIISQVSDRSVRGYLEEAAVCLAAGG